MSREIAKAMYEGAIEGCLLADLVNIDARFFSRNKNKARFSDDIEVLSFPSKVLVKVPSEARKFILDERYTPFILTKEDDEDEYDYVLNITSRIRIGFYK